MRPFPVIYAAAAASIAALLPAAASAHVAAVPAQAPAGSYAAVAFRVGHGCGGGAATTALRIETPAGLTSVRAQPKPGWTVAIERDGERVQAVTWTGRLPDEQFDDFGLLIVTPKEGGPLYFPAIQTCDGQEAQWTEIPGPGETARRPAPLVTLIPSGAAAGHENHAP